jgi:hypothetical protein
MDPSLARGVKNQAFREMAPQVDTSIDRFKKLLLSSKAGTSLNNWNRFTDQIESTFGDLLIKKHIGGSKRKPFLCVSTLDNQLGKSFNSWNEQCLNSVQLITIYSPWYFEAIYAGYSISEHAVQRIYERTIESDALNVDKSKISLLTEQLLMAPAWSSFWINFSHQFLSGGTAEKVSVAIPTATGFLLGELSTKSIHKVEIRTFVSDALLHTEQRELKKNMLIALENINSDLLPFFPSLPIAGITGIEKGLDEINESVRFFLPQLKALALSKHVHQDH